jgi:hypothetical protein
MKRQNIVFIEWCQMSVKNAYAEQQWSHFCLRAWDQTLPGTGVFPYLSNTTYSFFFSDLEHPLVLLWRGGEAPWSGVWIYSIGIFVVVFFTALNILRDELLEDQQRDVAVVFWASCTVFCLFAASPRILRSVHCTVYTVKSTAVGGQGLWDSTGHSNRQIC